VPALSVHRTPYFTDLYAVYSRFSSAGRFGGRNGVRTALCATTAVRPLQLEARCIAAGEHFAVRNFHIYCQIFLQLRIRNVQKMSVRAEKFRYNRHSKGGAFLMRVNEPSDRKTFWN